MSSNHLAIEMTRPAQLGTVIHLQLSARRKPASRAEQLLPLSELHICVTYTLIQGTREQADALKWLGGATAACHLRRAELRPILERSENTRADHILLLTISNIFMTFAWYGHLKFRSEALWKVILASWGIAFFEYCFQVPANRIGSYEFNGAQLKTIQEVITLVVFTVFSVSYLGEKFRWNYGVGFAFIVLGAFFVFHK